MIVAGVLAGPGQHCSDPQREFAMIEFAFIRSRSVLGLFTFLAAFAAPAGAATQARISDTYGRLPLQFEANQGQAHQDVRFLSRGPGYSLYLTAAEAVLVLSRPNPEGKHDGRSAPGQREAQVQAMPVALRMSIVGAAPAPLVSGREELPGKANYFIGKDSAKWRTNVPTYAKVHYREVYPGIDLIYYGNQRQLEYDFVVAPGADPKKIGLGFKGADKLEIDEQGELVLHVSGGAIRQHKRAAMSLEARIGPASRSPRTTAAARSSSIRWCSRIPPISAAAPTTRATTSPWTPLAMPT